MTVRRIVTMTNHMRMEMAVDATGAAWSRWLYVPPDLSADDLARAELARAAALRRYAKQQRKAVLSNPPKAAT